MYVSHKRTTMTLLLVEAEWRSPTRINTLLPLLSFFCFFLSATSFSTPKQKLWTQTVRGAWVIYLEPIVNSSLRLNENVERRLQSHASAGHLVKAKYTGLPAHYSWLLGRQQRGQQAGWGARLRKGATARTFDVKPFFFFVKPCSEIHQPHCFICAF